MFFSKMIDMIITGRSDQALIIVGGVTLNNIERRDKEIAYISDDSVMDEQKKCRKILQKLNFMDRSDFDGILEVVAELLPGSVAF